VLLFLLLSHSLQLEQQPYLKSQLNLAFRLAGVGRMLLANLLLFGMGERRYSIKPKSPWYGTEAKYGRRGRKALYKRLRLYFTNISLIAPI